MSGRLSREINPSGVGALIHYPVPIHGHEPYRELGQRGVALDSAETLAGEIVSLPLYPEMTNDTVEYVAGATRDAALATG